MLWVPEHWLAGVKLRAWRGADDRAQVAGLGVQKRAHYPARAYAKGERFHVMIDATHGPHAAQPRAVLRSYLERPGAQADVIQPSRFEDCFDRWGIWVRPSEPGCNSFTIARVLTEEVGKRFGIAEEDVYVVEHRTIDKRGQEMTHVHAVVPSFGPKMITRRHLNEIGKRLAQELVLERNLERALSSGSEQSGATTTGGAWDGPPTDKQLAILRANGRAARDITRGEASLVIESLIGERSWYGGRER